MPWNDTFECMPVEELQKFQLEKLKETVAWSSEKIPFYQKTLKESGITAAALRNVSRNFIKAVPSGVTIDCFI